MTVSFGRQGDIFLWLPQAIPVEVGLKLAINPNSIPHIQAGMRGHEEAADANDCLPLKSSTQSQPIDERGETLSQHTGVLGHRGWLDQGLTSRGLRRCARWSAMAHGRSYLVSDLSDLIDPVGFIAVIIGRAQLFTENTLYPVVLALNKSHLSVDGSLLWLRGWSRQVKVGGVFIVSLLNYGQGRETILTLTGLLIVTAGML